MRGSTLSLAVCALAAVACVDVAFSDGAGGGGPTTTTGGPGTGGAGSSVTTTGNSAGGSGSGGATTTGGSTGGGGSGPCVPTTETCNGIDDDCDGLTDQPPNGVPGNACSCEWTFDQNGHGYALCSAEGKTFDTVTCPGGTKKAVLQTNTEKSFLTAWLSPLLPAQSYAFIGFRQAPNSPSKATGWAWIVASGEQAGMVPTWTVGQPNDQGSYKPVNFENGSQDCGALGRYGAADAVNLVDSFCDGGTHVLCEDASPAPCMNGGSCLLAQGCEGSFDCNQPAGSECVANPKGETCNGLDDNCDGQVDASLNGHACGCVPFSNAGRDYKVCSTNREFANTECGPGYRLANVGDAAENAYLAGLIAGNGQYAIGLYQLTDATLVGEHWYWLDGTALSTSQWISGQPDDSADNTEEFQENCAVLEGSGWYDRPCGNSRPYICEEI